MSESSPRAATGRFDALDTLRCLAVLVMVQGHAFYVTLTLAERATRWHTWHDYIHGYTAPGFLFGAGLAFGFTTLSHKIGAHRVWGPTLRRRIYRYLSLFAIGYAIQLPSMGVAPSALSEGSIRVFLRVEALQHIGAALMFCQLLVVVLRRWWVVAIVTALLAVVTVLLGPAVSRMSLAALGPRAVSAYWTSEMGSTFPLIPWSGFVLVGVAVGALLVRARGRFHPLWIAGGFAVAGLFLVALSLGLDRLWPGIFGPHPYWKVSPYFFLRRLGWVVCALGLFALVDRVLVRLGRSEGAGRRWIRLISQQSLVVYVAHLVMLYGSPLNPGLRSVLWHRLDWVRSALVVAGLYLALWALLVAWQVLDQYFARVFFHVRRAGVAVMAVATLVVVVGANRMIFDTVPPGAVARPKRSAPAAVPASTTAEGSNPGSEPPAEPPSVQPIMVQPPGGAAPSGGASGPAPVLRPTSALQPASFPLGAASSTTLGAASATLTSLNP